MDLSPDEIAVLAAIVHGDGARVAADLMRACHGPALDGLVLAGMVEVWTVDRPRASVTLTPLAARWLGVELAERTRLESSEEWEKGEDGEAARWVRVEHLVITPYWARSDRGPDAPPMPIDAPAFGRVPPVPTADREPSRPGEYPLPFPDLVPDHRPGPGEERPGGRRARRRAEKRRAG